MPEASVDVQALTRALAEPFARSEVKFKPGGVSGNRAMALGFVDARVIQDRLDDVLGPLNWQDDYECLSDGSVVCRLRLRLGNEWVTKVDVGGPSEQPDGGDRLKAAFSDALKRAAVKFGVGRYLYRLPPQWVDYDPQRRQFVKPPALPDWALPSPAGKPTEAAAAKKESKPAELPAPRPAATATTPPATRPAAEQAPSRPVTGAPTDGKQLLDWLEAADARMVREGLASAGELLKHMDAWAMAGVKSTNPETWSRGVVALAVQEARNFYSARKRKMANGTPAAAAGV